MTAPRLIYLVTEDWYFMAHRLPMARAAKAAGYEVHVATRVNRHGAAIEAEGFVLDPVAWHRGSVNPLHLATSIAAVRSLYKRLKPALVHHIALQPAVVGSLAGRGLGIPQLNSILGFGSVFTSNGAKARLARTVLTPSLSRLIGGRDAHILVENPNDRDTLVGLGLKRDRIVVFPGSGVDVERFTPSEEPEGPVTVAFAGRMLEYKGVRTLVAAHELLAKRGSDVRLVLAGDPDPANPNSITAEELRAWAARPGVTWAGHVEDVAPIWRQAHIAVLASRGEGLPVSLLEAAASGRAIVASDVSGCREIARAGLNALLVPPDDAEALAGAIQTPRRGRAIAPQLRCGGPATGRRRLFGRAGGT